MEADYRSPQSIALERVVAPLEEAEAEQAIRSAVAELAERTSRYRVLGAELAIEKPQDEERAPDRMIEVLVADYDNRSSIRLVVGTDGAVAASEALDYEPAFSADEIAEARQLAERDERLAELARREELVVSTFSPANARRGERDIGLHYALPEDEVVTPAASVVVSLVTGEVRSADQDREPEGGR